MNLQCYSSWVSAVVVVLQVAQVCATWSGWVKPKGTNWREHGIYFSWNMRLSLLLGEKILNQRFSLQLIGNEWGKANSAFFYMKLWTYLPRKSTGLHLVTYCSTQLTTFKILSAIPQGAELSMQLALLGNALKFWSIYHTDTQFWPLLIICWSYLYNKSVNI